MTTTIAPLCMSCVRFDREGDGWPPTCEAYPGGIPDGILESQADHRLPLPGDHDLQYVYDPRWPRPSDALEQVLAEARTT